MFICKWEPDSDYSDWKGELYFGLLFAIPATLLFILSFFVGY